MILIKIVRNDQNTENMMGEEKENKENDGDACYADPYKADKRKLYKIGAGFDSKTRQMNDWKIKE